MRLTTGPPSRLVVSVGDLIDIEASGPCSGQADVTAQGDKAITRRPATEVIARSPRLSVLYDARTPGTVHLGITIAMCAVQFALHRTPPAIGTDFECRGGIANLGTVDVLVGG